VKPGPVLAGWHWPLLLTVTHSWSRLANYVADGIGAL
jgi:hypothetical protein